MNLFKWLQRKKPTPDAQTEARSLSPIEAYAAGGGDITTANPRTAEILRLAEQSHAAQQRRQRRDSSTRDGLPVENADDAVLRLLGGANFGPGARLILPSGTELRGDEAQAFTSAYADEPKD